MSVYATTVWRCCHWEFMERIIHPGLRRLCHFCSCTLQKSIPNVGPPYHVSAFVVAEFGFLLYTGLSELLRHTVEAILRNGGICHL